MPAPELTIVSANDPMAGKTAAMFYEQIICDPDNSERIFANGSLSFILPEYYRVYQTGIRPIIDGLLTQQTYENGTSDQRPIIYGLLTLAAMEDLHGFIAYVHEDDAHRFDDPATAAHNYQANLVAGTNTALAALRSPYRLAELAIHA
jgi:hypothetical protein